MISIFTLVVLRLLTSLEPMISIFTLIVLQLLTGFEPMISIFTLIVLQLLTGFEPMISIFTLVVLQLLTGFEPIIVQKIDKVPTNILVPSAGMLWWSDSVLPNFSINNIQTLSQNQVKPWQVLIQPPAEFERLFSIILNKSWLA
jgi:hypothetical protein